MHKFYLVVIPLAFMVMSCNDTENTTIKTKSEVQPAVTDQLMTQQELLDTISVLEKKVFTGDFYVQPDAGEDVKILDDFYNRYAEAFRYDRKNSPKFMLRRAAFKREEGKPLEAIKIYEKVQQLYPEHSENAQTAFLVAYVYDDALKNKELAKTEYQRVIEKYAGSFWAKQAEQRLKTIDISDEELVRQFQQNNATTNP